MPFFYGKDRKMRSKIWMLIEFITNPHLLLCLAAAWVITNGWSYAFFAIGTYFGIEWMTAVGAGYMAFLWLPISPEKIVTFGLAIFFLKKFFPYDRKTLGVIRRFKAEMKRKKQMKK